MASYSAVKGDGRGGTTALLLLSMFVVASAACAVDEVRMFVELTDRGYEPAPEHTLLEKVVLDFHVVETESNWTLRCGLVDPLGEPYALCPGDHADPPVCDEQPPTTAAGLSVRITLDRSFYDWIPGMYRLDCIPNEVGSFSQRLNVQFQVREGEPTPEPTPTPTPEPTPNRGGIITPVPPKTSLSPSAVSPTPSESASPEPLQVPSVPPDDTGPVCGDRICEKGENSTSCCSDCGCSEGLVCLAGTCMRPTDKAAVRPCGGGEPCTNIGSVKMSIENILRSRLEVTNEMALLETQGYRITRPHTVRPFTGYRFRVLAVKGSEQVIIEGDIEAATGNIVSYHIIGEREPGLVIPEWTSVLALALVVFAASYVYLSSMRPPSYSEAVQKIPVGEAEAEMETMNELGSVQQIERNRRIGAALEPSIDRPRVEVLRSDVPKDWSEDVSWHRHQAVAHRREDALRIIERLAPEALTRPEAALTPEDRDGLPPEEGGPPPRPAGEHPPARRLKPAPKEDATDEDEELIDSWLDEE
ncbi:MAG: hypothetical protein QF415_10560 [Candidatus Undinarchaeales archaeon]|jgi:hypothetical protein|nr:hypothetical protein [Candidatus Undinarchaeales archaeon]MDP7493198.1 hypothetical protein [Candidatus Undinarchaeales archaeon]